jgi:hypothetical protein
LNFFDFLAVQYQILYSLLERFFLYSKNPKQGRWYLSLDDNYDSYFRPKELTTNFQDVLLYIWTMIKDGHIDLNSWSFKNSTMSAALHHIPLFTKSLLLLQLTPKLRLPYRHQKEKHLHTIMTKQIHLLSSLKANPEKKSWLTRRRRQSQSQNQTE